MLRNITGAIAALSVAVVSLPNQADACGGFFCGFEPVDQTAERIIFRVHPNQSVTMAVQIQYQGAAEDFAWVLPLPEVPDPDSLATFPLAAMVGLDARTGPQFIQPADCYGNFYAEADASGQPVPSAGGNDDGGRGVVVHIQQQVGNYEAAVVESNDAKALHTWLVTNGYRVGTSMQKIVELYINEGMKFLALKLVSGAGVEDIQPFMLTLPGETPNIPLRLTSIAAEPEMSLAIFVLGDMRYGGANWPNLDIDPKSIIWSYGTDAWWGALQTNYTKRVAEAVDAAGGQGWVTQLAGSTQGYLDLLRRQKTSIEENLPNITDEESRKQQEDTLANIDALLGLMDGASYLTRLYTRVSAEEMSSDPTFKRVPGGDVSNVIQLERYVDGRDLCPWVDEEEWPTELPETTTPCDFATCGAGGICRDVVSEDGTGLVAGCGCVPGATARATVDADGNDGVVCQDQRMSFLNPGDRDENNANPLPDPCVGFSCGAGGRCVAVNLTPTCVCDQGLVAVGGFADGVRNTSCETPTTPVPSRFYNGRLPAIKVEAGRKVEVPEPDPYVDARLSGGGCAVGRASIGRTALPASIVLLAAVLGLTRRRRHG